MNLFRKEERSPAFYLYFYFQALKGLLRTQNLVLPENTLQIKYDLRVKSSDIRDWYRLFDEPREVAHIPFCYYSRLYELFFLQYMDAMKFNYKNIRHLYHERELFDDAGMVADRKYSVLFRIADISVLPKNRAVFATEVHVKDESARTILLQRDYIFLKNISGKNISMLEAAKQFRQQIPVAGFIGLSQKESVLKAQDSVRSMTVAIPIGMGVKYGHLSGDLNPLHTGRILSRLFGINRPFIQGGCIIHMLMKIFYADLGEHLGNYHATFCRPVYEDQTCRLLYDESCFELLDCQNKLLVSGARTPAVRTVA